MSTALAPLRVMTSAASLGLEPGVDRDQHTACGQQPECGDHPFGRVRRPDGQPVALGDTQPGEGSSSTEAVKQFGEGQPHRTVDDRFGITEAVAAAEDHLGDGLPGQVGARHTVTRRDRLPPMIFA
jgi:hypothetical protein